jgi:hypothetical protein
VRLQTPLSGAREALDDASADDLRRLRQLGEEVVAKNDAQLDWLCALLSAIGRDRRLSPRDLARLDVRADCVAAFSGASTPVLAELSPPSPAAGDLSARRRVRPSGGKRAQAGAAQHMRKAEATAQSRGEHVPRLADGQVVVTISLRRFTLCPR